MKTKNFSIWFLNERIEGGFITKKEAKERIRELTLKKNWEIKEID